MTGPYRLEVIRSHGDDGDDYAVFAASGERIDCDTLDAAEEVRDALNERHLRNTAAAFASASRGILPSVWGDEK